VLGFIAIQFMDFGCHDVEQAVQVDATPEEQAEPPSLGSFYSISGTSIMRAALKMNAHRSIGVPALIRKIESIGYAEAYS